jgi:ABC-2 type transport system permease protein
MRIINLALKDISQVLRDRRMLIFMLLMPVVFTLIMGLAFNSSNKTDTRLQIGWIDQDGGSRASQELKSMLAGDASLKLAELDARPMTEIISLVQKGGYAAVIEIPAGYGQALTSDQPVSLQVTLAPDSNGSSAGELIRAHVLRMASSAQISSLVVKQAEAVNALSAADAPAFAEQTLEKALQAWQKTSLSVRVNWLQSAKPSAASGNPYNQTSPGMLVQFVVFGLISSASLLVAERKSHTLQRLITTSMSRTQILLGHFLAMFTLVFAQELILIIFGALALKVSYLAQPLATLIVAVFFAMWSASLGLLIGVVAKGEEQVTLFSLLGMFLFTALGGAWFPLESTGRTFSTVAHFMPTAWAMDGFQNIIQRGLGLTSTMLPALILCAYTLAFLALAAWRFKVE